MSSSKRLCVGKILSTHGLAGELLVGTSSGKESTLGALDHVTVDDKQFDIVEAAWMPRGWKIQLSGVDSLEDAKKLVGAKLMADRSALPLPKQNQFYVEDLVGLIVIDSQTGEPLGTFAGVESSENIDWWRIQTAQGDFVIPANNHFIDRVGIEEGSLYLKNVTDLKGS